MTGHADVTASVHVGRPLSKPSPNNKGRTTSEFHYGAHGYSGDSGYGISTDDLYQASKGGRKHIFTMDGGGPEIIKKYAQLGKTQRGGGRINPIGWNNQVRYVEIKEKNNAPGSRDDKAYLGTLSDDQKLYHQKLEQ